MVSVIRAIEGNCVFDSFAASSCSEDCLGKFNPEDPI